MSLTGYNPTTITSFNTGDYRHVALSISGTIHTLYVDGSVVATNPTAGNIFSIYTSAIQNIYIGCAGDLSYGYTGIIDDFKIWNRALPYKDVNAIYLANRVPILNTAFLYFPLQGNISNFGKSTTYSLATPTYTRSYVTTLGKTGLEGRQYAFKVSFEGTSNFTLSFWLYVVEFSQEFYAFGSGVPGYNLMNFVNINNINGATQVTYRHTGSVSVNLPYTRSSWTHWTIVVNAPTTNLKIYKNSVPLSDFSTPPIGISNLLFPYLTEDHPGSYLRHICLFNSALNAAQISEIYTSTS